jgi:hypothetical protein
MNQIRGSMLPAVMSRKRLAEMLTKRAYKARYQVVPIFNRKS